MKSNYKNYIVARATSNFGNSVFLQMCIIYLTSTTMSEINLSINYLIIAICGMFIVFFWTDC
jgi:hypothetical protein